MAKGRPTKTIIRERIVTLLGHVGSAYGYELYKLYKSVFEPVGLRNIYYNLKKGLELGEFIIVEAKRESGEFTWGKDAEHIYYTTGPFANPGNITEKQRNKLVEAKKRPSEVNWHKELLAQTRQFDQMITDFHSKAERMKYEDRRKLNELLKLRSARLKDWAAEKLGKEEAKEVTDKISELAKRLQ